jgi:tRNA A58 N-methylase Trm61
VNREEGELVEAVHDPDTPTVSENEMESFDPQEQEARRRNVAASGWARWWEVWERAAQPVSDRLVELAGITAGHSVLDLATGLGEPAITAARRVGPRGRIIATDCSPDMLH